METKRVARRKHSAEFRAEILQACRQSGASVAAIALRNGLNANVIHRWRRLEGQTTEVCVGNHAAVNTRANAEFVPLQLPTQTTLATPSEIRMELRRGASSVTVIWPAQCAGDCGTWLREWLR
jgi:transposase-like protein